MLPCYNLVTPLQFDDVEVRRRVKWPVIIGHPGDMSVDPFRYLFENEVTESFDERKLKVVEYLRAAPDPNEEGESGRNLLTLALIMQLLTGCENLAAELLDRGADPNQPSPMSNLIMLVRNLKLENSPIPLLKKFIEKGMELNNIYDLNDPHLPRKGQSTLLDLLDAWQGTMSPKRKTLNALADKYVGGLGGIRGSFTEAIALLESHGAKRAADMLPEHDG